jgi:hypothetical protein
LIFPLFKQRFKKSLLSFSNNILLSLNKREIFPPFPNTYNLSKDIIFFNEISKQKSILDNNKKNNIINDKNIILPNDYNDIINHKGENKNIYINKNINNNEILLNENYYNFVNKKEKDDENGKTNTIEGFPNFPQFLNDQKENKTQNNKNAVNKSDINSNNIINNFHLFNSNYWNYLNNNFFIPNPLLQFPNSSFFNKRLLFNSLDNKFNDYPLNLKGNGI